MLVVPPGGRRVRYSFWLGVDALARAAEDGDPKVDFAGRRLRLASEEGEDDMYAAAEDDGTARSIVGNVVIDDWAAAERRRRALQGGEETNVLFENHPFASMLRRCACPARPGTARR